MENIAEMSHAFVICAYQTSPYLEACIQSLLAQTVKTEIVMATATPNEHICFMAEKYQLKLYVNTGAHGIAQDWNFAVEQCARTLVTIAHQDDIYEPDYAATILMAAQKAKHPLIIFTDYGELREERRVNRNRLLGIKRILLFPLRWKVLHSSIFVRRRILSLGSAISCPAVTLCRRNLPQPVFPVGCRSNVDWLAWEKISKMAGQFVYCPKICMYHRIHEDSTTSGIIKENNRMKEDLEVFKKFWPEPIARLIEHFYKAGEKSNRI